MSNIRHTRKRNGMLITRGPGYLRVKCARCEFLRQLCIHPGAEEHKARSFRCPRCNARCG